MSTLDELLGRIDADLALPAFPPLQAAPPCPPRPPEPPVARPRPRPRPPWWRRWFQ